MITAVEAFQRKIATPAEFVSLPKEAFLGLVENANKCPYGILKLLDLKEAFIMGGIFRDIWSGISPRSDYEDIDLFFETETAFIKAEKIFLAQKDKDGNKYELHHYQPNNGVMLVETPRFGWSREDQDSYLLSPGPKIHLHKPLAEVSKNDLVRRVNFVAEAAALSLTEFTCHVSFGQEAKNKKLSLLTGRRLKFCRTAHRRWDYMPKSFSLSEDTSKVLLSCSWENMPTEVGIYNEQK